MTLSDIIQVVVFIFYFNSQVILILQFMCWDLCLSHEKYLFKVTFLSELGLSLELVSTGLAIILVCGHFLGQSGETLISIHNRTGPIRWFLESCYCFNTILWS